MKLAKVLFAIVFSIFFGVGGARASSLDELYRDIIRSDNLGYLPLFVKNRKTPDFLLEIEGYETPKTETVSNAAPAVNLSNDFRQRIEAAKFKQEQWQKTIEAVKTNQVTPVELKDISGRVKENDPQATEILAWMYAVGVGVTPNFVESFNLYRKAAQLNVADAEKNAMIVYQAMSKEQRHQIRKVFKPL